MEWAEITIETTAAGVEPLGARLVALGIPSFQIEEESDLAELIDNNQKYWDYIDEELERSRRGVNRVKLYERMELLSDTLLLLKQGLEALKTDLPEVLFGSLGISVEVKNEEDWANAWKRFYKPTPVGKRILIVPEWEKDYDAMGRIVFINNPGMSFGTGLHASTRLCMNALERRVKPGDTILDLGCGSGILSIIGLLLGADRAVAVDIDGNAVDVAKRNAARNGIGADRYTGFSGNILGDSGLVTEISLNKYSVVLANIVADVIIGLCPLIPALLAKDGVFITSGIIEERKDEVTDAILTAGLKVIEISDEDGWCAVSAGL